MNKFTLAGLLLGFSTLSAQSIMGYMGKRHAIGAEVLISPAFSNPVEDRQPSGQAFYGMNVQFGGSYMFSLSHGIRAGLAYHFMENAVASNRFSDNDWMTKSGQTVHLEAHTFSMPIDIFMGAHRAPLGPYLRIQPEVVLANVKNTGGFNSPEAIGFEHSSILPGLTFAPGVNYIFANRIMLDFSLCFSLYFPNPIPWGLDNMPLVSNGSPDGAISRRLTAARFMMLRTGIYFLL